MGDEIHTQAEILRAWGAHPSLTLARFNVGVGWFGPAGKSARESDPGARPVRFGIPGLADICGIAAPHGRVIMLEVKSRRGRMRDAQRAMQRVVSSRGGVYAVVRSLAEADAVLTPIVGPRT